MLHDEKHTSQMCGLADDSLEAAFDGEYLQLTVEHAHLIWADFLDAEISANEYRRRIGAGNLAEYAKTLAAGKRRAELAQG